MIRDMLCEDYESYGGKEHDYGDDIGKGLNGGSAVHDFIECLNKGEFRQSNEACEFNGLEVIYNGRIVYYLEISGIGKISDNGEDRACDIARSDADYEGDELHALGTLDGSKDGDAEGDKADEDADEVIFAGGSSGDIAYRARAEAETDESNGRSDDDGGKELLDPLGSDEVDNECDDGIDKTCDDCADDYAECAESGRADQGADEGEGAAEEDGALTLGEEDVNEGTDACAEKRGGLAEEFGSCCGIHEHGNEHGCGYDSKQLLEAEYQILAEFGPFVDVIDEFHFVFLRIFSVQKSLAAHGKAWTYFILIQLSPSGYFVLPASRYHL